MKRIKKTREYYKQLAGVIAICRNKYTKGYNVLYLAEKQGLDTAGGKYIDVCEVHGTINNFTSLRNAKRHLRYSDWCEQCMNER